MSDSVTAIPMSLVKQSLTWFNLGDAPKGPGLYAWYYTVHWGKQDIKTLIESVSRCEDASEKKEILRTFLANRLFQPYQEGNLLTKATGALNRLYQGELEHSFSLSDYFLDSLASSPDSISVISQILPDVSPEFLRPLYVGMSDAIHGRLHAHKLAIEKYRREIANARALPDDEDLEDDIRNFAIKVARRGLLPGRLTVETMEIKGLTAREYNMVEHLVNRTQFPILGTK